MDDEQLRQSLAERAQCERDHPVSERVPHNGFGWIGTRCPKCGFMFFGEWEKGFPVSYDDEVTPEQVAAIDKLVTPEFEGRDWGTVEGEC